MPRTRTRPDDFRYLNTDEFFIHRDHDTNEEVGRSRGVFYGTRAELERSGRNLTEVVIRVPEHNKCLVARGTGLTEAEARRICNARTEFLTTDARGR